MRSFGNSNDAQSGDAPIPFLKKPRHNLRHVANARKSANAAFPRLARSHEEVLAAFDDVSRRMEDLARQLKCLGYFNDDGDRPKAA